MKLIPLLLFCFILPTFVVGQELPAFKVNIEQIKNATAKQSEDMTKALEVFEKVMNDKDFQTDLLKKTFYFHGTEDPNHKLSTLKIVNKLYDGKESHQTDIDHEADIYWQVYNGLGRRTIGSGYPSKKMIYTKPSFINKGNIAEIAGHIAHEWTHKFYFIDGNYRGKKRSLMVSYAFGYLVTKHAAKYI